MDLVKSSILKATAVTVLLLSLGLMVGLQMDSARTDYLEEQLRESNLKTETFLVTQTYLEDSSNNYCKVIEQQIPDLAKKNAQIGRDLQSFSSKRIGKARDYQYLTKRYYVNQLRLYTVLQNYRERCNTETNLVLFFFDGSADSKRQGAVLTKYRREVDNKTYVFSYNMETKNSTVLEMLKTDYSVDEGPTMVINGDDIYRRYVSLKELRQVI